MTLRDAVTTVVANAIKVHPDAEKIDWDMVCWQKDDKPWQPDLDKSLATNGVGHKDYIVFNTPGLTGLGGAGL
jgi:phenol hydroxylase P4 protein